MRTKLTGIAVAVTLAALAAGCGGGGSKEMSKADYEAKIQADGKAAQDAVNQISASFSSIGTVAKQVAAAEVAAKKAADDLAAVTPPKDIAADHDALVKALRVIDVELKELAKAARAGDAMAAAQAANALQNSPDVQAGLAALRDMKKKGYAVGVLGE